MSYCNECEDQDACATGCIKGAALRKQRLSGDAQEQRIAACLHACEGLDTADLKGNERGWLSEVVHAAARVERNLNEALRSRCAGNTKQDEPVCCQAYESSEQREPCPDGVCTLADQKDVRAILAAIEEEDGVAAPSAEPEAWKLVPIGELEELSIMAAISTADPNVEELEGILNAIGNKVEALLATALQSERLPTLRHQSCHEQCQRAVKMMEDHFAADNTGKR